MANYTPNETRPYRQAADLDPRGSTNSPVRLTWAQLTSAQPPCRTDGRGPPFNQPPAPFKGPAAQNAQALKGIIDLCAVDARERKI